MLAIDLVQGSPEWLAFRQNKIGASDAPVIMGVSPWTTPHALWEQKVGLRPAQATTARMQRGHDLEEPARQQFAQLMGIEVDPMVVQHREHDWMIASLDGLDKQGKCLVEIKHPGINDHMTALQGQVPEKYKPQLQHQIAVVESMLGYQLEKTYYCSSDGEKMVAVPVERDDKYIAYLIEQELEFWRCVQNFQPPKMNAKECAERTDELWVAAAGLLLSRRAITQAAVEDEEEARQTLIALSGKCNAQGGGIRLSHVTQKGNIDYKSIPELRGVDLEQYRKGTIEKVVITEV